MLRTEFQKRLKSYVWGTRSKQGHWFLSSDAPVTVRPPGLGEVVTTKRAIYAAFKGDVPEGSDLRPECGVRQCVCPDHQVFEPSRGQNPSRALHLADLDYSLGLGTVDQRPGKLPKGVSLAKIEQVRELSKLGHGLAAISVKTGISFSDIMKIRGGVFNNAVQNVKKGIAVRRRVKEDPSSGPVATEEEQEWLRSMQ